MARSTRGLYERGNVWWMTYRDAIGIMTCKSAVISLLVILALLLTTSAWAVPITGFLEATADTGWQGAFAVQLTDGTVTTGTSQTSFLGSFPTLPLTTTGCTVSIGCVPVTNVTTGAEFTMSGVILNLTGSATLGTFGNLSWGVQPLWLLPGDPSPTVAALANVNGILGGTTLTGPSSAFAFNGTLTGAFSSVAGGQVLNAIRLDFADGTSPPTSRTFLQGNVFIDNGVPVALGTPLSVPEPSSSVLLGLSFTGILLWRLRQVPVRSRLSGFGKAFILKRCG